MGSEEGEMFKCERCGSGYNGNYIGVESCPRCLLLDRVQAPLSFRLFRISETANDAGVVGPLGVRSGPPPGEGAASAQRVRSAR